MNQTGRFIDCVSRFFLSQARESIKIWAICPSKNHLKVSFKIMNR
jgi:hypothetical protein